MNFTLANQEEYHVFKEMALRKLAYGELSPEALGRIIDQIYSISYTQGRYEGEKYKEGEETSEKANQWRMVDQG